MTTGVCTTFASPHQAAAGDVSRSQRLAADRARIVLAQIVEMRIECLRCPRTYVCGIGDPLRR